MFVGHIRLKDFFETLIVLHLLSPNMGFSVRHSVPSWVAFSPMKSVTTTGDEVKVTSNNRMSIRVDMIFDRKNRVPPISGGVSLEVGRVDVQCGVVQGREPDAEDITTMDVFRCNRMEFVNKRLLGDDPHPPFVGGVVRPKGDIATGT